MQASIKCEEIWKFLKKRKESRPHVLIVDDDPEFRGALEDALTMQGIEVQSAPDGVQALQHIRQNPAKIRLILLDVVMPRMSGYEFLARLQQETQLKDIPILLMTAQPVAWNKPIAHAAIQKPFNVANLAACAKEISRPGTQCLD